MSVVKPVALESWCRALKHSVSAGIDLPRALKLQATRGPYPLRDLSGRVADRLAAGSTLEDGLKPEADRFPPPFLELVTVGEEAGHLPEVFAELEEYYGLQAKLRRDFWSQATWPIVQFVAAVVVIAVMLWVIGTLSQGKTDKPMDPLGLGLTGAVGAMKFVGGVVFMVAGVVVGYKLATRTFRGRVWVEGALLVIPGIGPCLEALAMGRLCLALRLTLGAGVGPAKALKLSLRATGNGAFMAHEKTVAGAVKKGRELAEAVSFCPAVPRDFVDIMTVAEVSGRVPESMAQQADFYREEAARRMKALSKMMSWGVYIFVSLLMCLAIFQMAGFYFGAISKVQ